MAWRLVSGNSHRHQPPPVDPRWPASGHLRWLDEHGRWPYVTFAPLLAVECRTGSGACRARAWRLRKALARWRVPALACLSSQHEGGGLVALGEPFGSRGRRAWGPQLGRA